MELYRKFRPRKLEDVVGQDRVVEQIKKMFERKRVPHAIMLSGPSGVGKNTLAYIIRDFLKCDKELDYHKIDCTNTRGIEMVRDIKADIRYKPRGGESQVYFIDEVHECASKTVQSGFLDLLENPPDDVYFILATTEPAKILNTIKTRCTEFKLNSLSEIQLTKVLERVIKLEEIKTFPSVVKKIIEVSGGSPRKALVELEQATQLDSEKDQLDSVEHEESFAAAFEIVKLLVYRKPKWEEVTTKLKQIDLSNPERLRQFILACSRTEILKAAWTSPRAYLVLAAFESNFFLSPGPAGEAWICRAAYEVCSRN
jgi:DNA polymerase III gamma/tau subunit